MEYMFLPLKRYAEFSGRSRRMEFWMYTLFLVLLWLVFAAIAMAIIGSALLSGGGALRAMMATGGAMIIVMILAFVIGLGLFIPTLAVGMRRLHDTDRSGWWLGGFYIADFVSAFLRGSNGGGTLGSIASLVTFLLFIVLLVFYCLDGTKGPNKYGPDPKGRVDAEVFA